MDLFEKSDIIQPQDARDLPARRGRIVPYLLHIGTLSGRHQMSDARRLQRSEATDQPAV